MTINSPDLVIERWAHGGLRLGTDGHKCHAWSVEGSDMQLLFGPKRARLWAVGGIYTVIVTRDDGTVYLHEPQPARFTGPIDDQTEQACLEAADLATRTHLAAIAFEGKAKADPALDQALAVTAQLPHQLQVWALLAYVTEKVQSARRRPR